jgi:hypothetical protein
VGEEEVKYTSWVTHGGRALRRFNLNRRRERAKAASDRAPGKLLQSYGGNWTTQGIVDDLDSGARAQGGVDVVQTAQADQIPVALDDQQAWGAGQA